jgi:hypothetical protein
MKRTLYYEIDTPGERQLPSDDTLRCLFVSTDNMDIMPVYLFKMLLPYVVAIGTLGSLAPKRRAHSASSAVLTINAGRRGAALARMWMILAVILAMSTTVNPLIKPEVLYQLDNGTVNVVRMLKILSGAEDKI